LGFDPLRKNSDVSIADGVIGQHRDTGAICYFLCETVEVITCLGRQSTFTQDTGCDKRVAPLRCKNNRAFGIRIE
jgi:hypothetical protein